MNNTEKAFIEILSAFVNEREPELPFEVDGEKLYNLAHSQSVAGIVSFVLHRAYRDDLLSQSKKLSTAYDKTIAHVIRREVETQNLFSQLSAEGIEHITFKGNVVKRSYPVKELRTFGDIDLIIKEENRKKSHAFMIKNGFTSEAMDGGAVYGYKRGKEFYEIHTSMNSERTKLSDYLKDYWSKTEKKQGLTYEFEPNFHFCYLISHIEKHVNCSNAGVRMYLDIALILKNDRQSLDLKKVREILRECSLEKFYDTTLYLCHRWFGTEKLFESELSESRYEAFCDFTLKGGTFGLLDVGADSSVRRSMKDGKVNKAKLILRHVFPPYREIRRMYPFFDGKPYLLPLSWVIHPFKAAKRSGLKNIKRVVNADVKTAQQEKELLRSVGSER